MLIPVVSSFLAKCGMMTILITIMASFASWRKTTFLLESATPFCCFSIFATEVSGRGRTCLLSWNITSRNISFLCRRFLKYWWLSLRLVWLLIWLIIRFWFYWRSLRRRMIQLPRCPNHRLHQICVYCQCLTCSCTNDPLWCANDMGICVGRFA